MIKLLKTKRILNCINKQYSTTLSHNDMFDKHVININNQYMIKIYNTYEIKYECYHALKPLDEVYD